MRTSTCFILVSYLFHTCFIPVSYLWHTPSHGRARPVVYLRTQKGARSGTGGGSGSRSGRSGDGEGGSSCSGSVRFIPLFHTPVSYPCFIPLFHTLFHKEAVAVAACVSYPCFIPLFHTPVSYPRFIATPGNRNLGKLLYIYHHRCGPGGP